MSVLLYEPGLFEVLESPAGPTTRYVTARAEAVAALARENVATNFYQRTGTLYQSIGVFPKETVDGVECEVGTDGTVTKNGWNYGLVLELGGDAHEIYRVNAPFLFSEENNPNPLIFDPVSVHHPGPQAKPWLRPALELVFLGG